MPRCRRGRSVRGPAPAAPSPCPCPGGGIGAEDGQVPVRGAGVLALDGGEDAQGAGDVQPEGTDHLGRGLEDLGEGQLPVPGGVPQGAARPIRVGVTAAVGEVLHGQGDFEVRRDPATARRLARNQERHDRVVPEGACQRRRQRGGVGSVGDTDGPGHGQLIVASHPAVEAWAPCRARAAPTGIPQGALTAPGRARSPTTWETARRGAARSFRAPGHGAVPRGRPPGRGLQHVVPGVLRRRHDRVPGRRRPPLRGVAGGRLRRAARAHRVGLARTARLRRRRPRRGAGGRRSVGRRSRSGSRC